MMKMIHSLWAFLVLALLIIVVIKAIVSFKKEFKDIDLRLALFTLIVSHIQLILGLGVYFSSAAYKSLKIDGVSSDGAVRMLQIEHPVAMLLAIALITIGYSKQKNKVNSIDKFKTIAIFYGISLILTLSMIPWNQWF